jgi:PleD family two-component response regulator
MVTDLVSRRAGPEFIVGMPGLTRLEAADRMQDVVEALRREQFLLPSGTLSVTCSVGVSALSVDGETVDSILQAAEKACRTSLRQEGGGSAVVAAGQPDAPSARALDIALIDTEDELFDMLSTRSYHLRHFRQADEALSALGGTTPEVKARIILIGTASPPMDGVTVVRQLAGGGVLKHARVLLLVPSESSAELDQVRGLGRIEPMVRPYDKAAVMRKVRRALSEQLTGKLKME